MMAQNRTPIDAEKVEPYCASQGIPNMCGAARRGVTVQHFQLTVPALAVQVALDFEAAGGKRMHDALYTVQLTNHVTQGTGICAPGDRTAAGLLVTSVVAADVIDVTVTGQLSGQLA